MATTTGFAAVVEFAFKGGNTGFPVRAPPILQRGGFSLCGTNVSLSQMWAGLPVEKSRGHCRWRVAAGDQLRIN